MIGTNGLELVHVLGGHMDIVNLMISKGADKWNYGLYSACERRTHGNCKFNDVSKGANNWEW